MLFPCTSVTSPLPFLMAQAFILPFPSCPALHPILTLPNCFQGPLGLHLVLPRGESTDVSGLPVPSPLHTSSLIAQSHFRKSCVSMMSWCCSSCATPACWRRCGFAGQATAPSTRSRWDTFTRACGCLGHGPPPERTLLQSLSLAGYFPSGFLHPDTDPRVGKITGRRKWQSTPVFLPGKSHGQMSLAG